MNSVTNDIREKRHAEKKHNICANTESKKNNKNGHIKMERKTEI